MRFYDEIRDVLALGVREVWAESVVSIITLYVNMPHDTKMMN